MGSSEQLGLTFQPGITRRIWTVRDLIGAARTSLERDYTDVWVEGEISNFRPADSGHLYFTLKDGDAQLRVVMFRTQARLLRFLPENGMQVIARGRVTIYEARGELQLMAEYLEPKGAGALQVAFEQLKARLAAEGLFDVARKKPVPLVPRRIGIVTSARGAAIQDILNVLRRRHEDVHVLIFPAQVQGEAAPGEVSSGVRYFNRAGNVDVIIVARGGGSIEDLAAFNDEGLARTIASSKLPVISAVGHETDFTVADFVADLRAPTPSAAAELVIESKHRIEEQVAGLRQRLARATRYRLLLARQTLDRWARHAAFARISDALARRQQRVDELVYRLAAAQLRLLDQYRRRLDVAAARVRYFDLRRRLASMRQGLNASARGLEAATRRLLLTRRAQWDRAGARLEQLSPLKVLDRGYALVFDASGKLVKDVTQVQVRDRISARLARGLLIARVEEKKDL
ncbi:MAG TPA: exodeoxyribonuclease VII large subunit [Terriglobales bacterium]|nr:exodeoxyribonuclease VII large subunit [Terriglobales bacterium]